ncbi:hypothetical protein FOZ63_033342 [Perkinsus olseni]|uniref:Uncharacterized protein n=1 Tax=Perkinsus olseni TaxID=32597 RepID=A0A7J6TGK2_PEROL|nr:hypothetical protein FOZ62_028723 [Perkinsus olseni]KAF4744031.1 hypothetical protein FOZ63_033342 [Perkinsus olseni]
MVKSLSTWLMTTQLLAATTAQHFGKFVHDAGVYRITYDIDEDGGVEFTFKVPGQPGVSSLGRAIRRFLPEDAVQDSDLKTLTNYSRLSFGTIFLGRKLHFLREVPPLTVGFYKYNERTEINRKLALAILPSLKVEVIVECVGSSVNYVDAVLLDFEGGLTEANNVFTTRPADTGSFARVLQRSKRAFLWSDLRLKGDRPLMFSADRRTLYLSLSEDNTLALSRA